MNLSRIEQETIFVFNEAESTATVQVYNAKLRRRLEQLERDRPDDVKHDYNGDFIIPNASGQSSRTFSGTPTAPTPHGGILNQPTMRNYPAKQAQGGN